MKEQARCQRRSRWLMIPGIISILMALLLSGCSSSAPTWQEIGPNAQSILSLALGTPTTTTIFAGSSQGLFRSLDGGNTWAADNTGLPVGATVNSVAPDPTQVGVVYAGTDAGVFLSSDDGDHWQSMSQGLPSGAPGVVTALAINPSDPMTLYAGTAGQGVYVSHNAAKSWSASAQGLPSGATVHALLAETQGQSVQLFAALAGAGVYRSSDGGTTWAASNTGLPSGVDGLSLLAQPSNPGGLYVGTGAGAYRSADNGANWKAVNDGLGQPPAQVFALALNDKQPAFMYAATSTGVYRTANGGAAWDAVAEGIPSGHPARALAIVGSASGIGIIYAAVGQVYRYPNTLSSGGGQLVTIVVLGILALLFVWLFLQQRRLLQRLTLSQQPRPRRPPAQTNQSGPAEATGRGARDAGAAQRDGPAASNARHEPGAGGTEGAEHQ